MFDTKKLYNLGVRPRFRPSSRTMFLHFESRTNPGFSRTSGNADAEHFRLSTLNPFEAHINSKSIILKLQLASIKKKFALQ